MNRLTPLIARHSAFGTSTADTVATLDLAAGEAAPTRLADDLRLFASAWMCGLVFFGTLLA